MLRKMDDLYKDILEIKLDRIIYVKNVVTNEIYLARCTRYLPGEGYVDLPLLQRVEDGR